MVDSRDIDSDDPRPSVLRFGSDFWTMVYSNKRLRLVAWLMLAFNIGFPLGFIVGRVERKTETIVEKSEPITADERALVKVREIQQRILLQHPKLRLGVVEDE